MQLNTLFAPLIYINWQAKIFWDRFSVILEDMLLKHLSNDKPAECATLRSMILKALQSNGVKEKETKGYKNIRTSRETEVCI